MATREEIYACSSKAQLLAIEKRDGYKFGWANKVYAGRKAGYKKKRIKEINQQIRSWGDNY